METDSLCVSSVHFDAVIFMLRRRLWFESTIHSVRGLTICIARNFFAIRDGVLESRLPDGAKEQLVAISTELNKTIKDERDALAGPVEALPQGIRLGPIDSRLYVDEDGILPTPS